MLDRRNLLTLFLAAPAWSFLGAGGSSAQEAIGRLEPTPACGDQPDPTPTSAEGPFFRSGAPDQHELVRRGWPGERITVAGAILDTSCRPLKNALVQIWHADSDGEYDDVRHQFRGRHRSDANGRWWFSTIVPARYPGRTRHYHLKVKAPGRSLLTTQLFFPGEAQNRGDRLFDERLVMQLTQTSDGRFGRFDIVV